MSCLAISGNPGIGRHDSSSVRSVTRSRYLLGNLAPVAEELTAFDLPVEGTIPEGLDGLYVRNGPNPAAVTDGPYHWVVGDGMVHGVRLGDGRAAWYRNRWVRTEALHRSVGREVPAGPPDITIGGVELSPANTNVVAHAGMLLAMCEVSLPVRLDEELETLGRHDYGGAVQRIAFNAHSKVDPDTGELHVIGYDVLREPFVRYHVIGADGTYVRGVDIEIPGPAMMHDIALTTGHVVLLDLPVLFDLDAVAAGRPMPFAWSDDYGARLGLLRRDAPEAGVRWFDIDPCFVYHTVNAYEDGDRVVVDGFRYRTTFAVEHDGPDDGVGNTLCRWTIDPSAGVAKEETVDGRTAEFPRVDPRRMGRPYRYGYAVRFDAVFKDAETSGFHKYDMGSGAVEAHPLPSGQRADEAVFVPAGADAAEDDGWLLSFVYDAGTGRSSLVVLDASDFAAPPLATVRLPTRVPHGFHGSFVPA
jgi:carotenoid cleavage dioxygenase-like enzyme